MGSKMRSNLRIKSALPCVSRNLFHLKCVQDGILLCYSLSCIPDSNPSSRILCDSIRHFGCQVLCIPLPKVLLMIHRQCKDKMVYFYVTACHLFQIQTLVVGFFGKV